MTCPFIHIFICKLPVSYSITIPNTDCWSYGGLRDGCGCCSKHMSSGASRLVQQQLHHGQVARARGDHQSGSPVTVGLVDQLCGEAVHDKDTLQIQH